MAFARIRSLRTFALASICTAAALAGCAEAPPAGEEVSNRSSDITDVPHTEVERQSIGNCWLYAEATWAESMHLTATGTSFDVSQSYWTYWHWFDQIRGRSPSEIQTGGNESTAHGIVRARGVVAEANFVGEDTASEMSFRQSAALAAVNQELKSGRLATSAARRDGKLVRQVLDEAWRLTDEVRGYLTAVFGEDGTGSVGDVSPAGTPIIAAAQFPVKYTRRATDGGTTEVTADLGAATREWRTAYYPSFAWGDQTLEGERRAFLQRVQRALHDRQPVIVTWNVDFNAMESGMNERRGSFNLTTLGQAGRPGRQGGHMVVLEDYEAETAAFGLLKAGVTVDGSTPEGQAKLAAALDPTTTIKFLRVKNSWGALRDDRASVPGFPGYHDLAMDYLNGPIPWCPNATNPTNETCGGTSVPLRNVVLPPGY
jgi:hypothetical protein